MCVLQKINICNKLLNSNFIYNSNFYKPHLVMKNLSLITSFALLGALSAYGANTLWQGSVSNDFTNDANWNNGAPTGIDIATVRAGATTTLTGVAETDQMRVGQNTGIGATTTVNFNTGSDYSSNRTEIGYSLGSDTSASNGTLNVNDGTHAITTLYVANKAQASNANDVTGTVVINGGSLSVESNAYIATASNYSSGSSTATVTVNAGTLNYTGTSGQFYLGHTGSGTLHVNGGTVNLANGLKLSHTANGSSNLRLSSGQLNVTGGFFDWGAGSANMAFEISEGTMVLNGSRVGKLDQYFGTDGTDGLATVSMVGGLVDDSAFSSVYTQDLRQIEIDGYTLNYGYDGTDTGVWATAIPETSSLGIFGLALFAGFWHSRSRRK